VIRRKAAIHRQQPKPSPAQSAHAPRAGRRRCCPRAGCGCWA